MFFCQISQILILYLEWWWIFFLVNLLICCSVMAVSVTTCSQRVMGMGITMWSLHSQRVMLMFLSPSHLVCTFASFFYFSLCLSYFDYLTWRVSVIKSCMNCNYFCFSLETMRKREGFFVPIFLFHIVYLFFSSCIQNCLFKNRGRKDYLFSCCLRTFQ